MICLECLLLKQGLAEQVTHKLVQVDGAAMHAWYADVSFSAPAVALWNEKGHNSINYLRGEWRAGVCSCKRTHAPFRAMTHNWVWLNTSVLRFTSETIHWAVDVCCIATMFMQYLNPGFAFGVSWVTQSSSEHHDPAHKEKINQESMIMVHYDCHHPQDVGCVHLLHAYSIPCTIQWYLSGNLNGYINTTSLQYKWHSFLAKWMCDGNSVAKKAISFRIMFHSNAKQC